MGIHLYKGVYHVRCVLCHWRHRTRSYASAKLAQLGHERQTVLST